MAKGRHAIALQINATISYKFILRELLYQMLYFITFKSARKIHLFFTEALLSENGNALKGH
jgi:hypothetical protein